MPPIPTPPQWPIPKLTLRVDDLTHPGVPVFFDNLNPTNILKDAIVSCFTWLYDNADSTVPHKSVNDMSFPDRLIYKFAASNQSPWFCDP